MKEMDAFPPGMVIPEVDKGLLCFEKRHFLF